jgi:hypothetical protein
MTANLIHSIIDPNLEINYKHDLTTGLLDKYAAKDDCDNIEPFEELKNDADNLNINYKHAAKDDCGDIEPFEDLKNDADNISVDTNTQDVAGTVNITNSKNESYITGTLHHEMKKKVHVAHKKQGKNKKKGGGAKEINLTLISVNCRSINNKK